MEYDLLSIGDSTVDVFLEIDPADTEAVCSLKKEECLICFPYGSKIPVKKLTRVVAVGNAANNAIGSARLGLNTAIYTVIGSDQDSQEIKQVFEEENVDTRFLAMESGKRSNFSAVINYAAERTIFVYHEPRTYEFPQGIKAKWAYYTSTGEGKTELNSQVVEFVRNSRSKLGFNPGSYHLKEGLAKLKPILEVTEVLLLNREEAHSLIGGDLEDIKGLMKSLKVTGPEIIVITDGPNGSYLSIDGREIWYLGIPDTPVIERTGAGDAYSTGFLAAVIQGKNLPEAMIWGTMNATSVVQYIGAREGLLTPTKMEEFVEKYREQVKPRMI